MTNKDKINSWAVDRSAQGYEIDDDLLNLTYWVIKNYSPKISIEDIDLIYDNLAISSEQINEDTVEYYDDATIRKLSSHNLAYVEKEIKRGYFFLLDFYALQNGYLKHFDRKFIKFKKGYNCL